MAAKKSSRGNPHPLIIEPYPENYNGYPFITLIQYRKDHFVTIVDNTDDTSISAYVLDMCGPVGLSEEALILATLDWYEKTEGRTIPVSIAYSRAGIAFEVREIYRTFSVEYVTRVIGPLPKFEMDKIRSVKKRRRKPIPDGVEIIKNKHVVLSNP